MPSKECTLLHTIYNIPLQRTSDHRWLFNLNRARNPRWEPGMGMIPDPRQIGDGDGDGDWDRPGGFRALGC
jgi:hypothetical protein